MIMSRQASRRALTSDPAPRIEINLHVLGTKPLIATHKLDYLQILSSNVFSKML